MKIELGKKGAKDEDGQWEEIERKKVKNIKKMTKKKGRKKGNE